MARLPVPGADNSTWGDLLNEFLAVEHNTDGTLRLDGTLAGKYAKPASGIPKHHLASDVQTSLTKADTAPDNLSALHDTQLVAPATGHVLAYDGPAGRWVNTSLRVANLTATTQGAGITKTDLGLGNVTNDAQLPLTGGTLTGQLTVQADLRVANPVNTAQYVRISTDNYWARVEPIGMSGFVFRGGTVLFEPGIAVFNTATVRPQNNLVTQLGTTTTYYSNLYAQRHYLNASAYLDGATPGVIEISNGANLALGATTGTKIGTAATQKLGFFNATPVAQQMGGSLSAGSTYTENERLMLMRMWTALRNLGLIS